MRGQHGLLARDDDGRFRLGGRLVGWGAQAAARGRARGRGPARARPASSTRPGRARSSTCARATHRVCVATHERASGLRDTVPLGAVMPLTKGSGGKVLLAWARRPRPSSTVARGRARRGARARGSPQSVGEREAGVASVSAPVRAPTARSSPRSASADRPSGWARTRGAGTARPVRAAAAVLARGVTSE